MARSATLAREAPLVRAVPREVRPAAAPAKPAPSHEEISRLAFELFEARGHEHGHDLADWLEAERRLSG